MFDSNHDFDTRGGRLAGTSYSCTSAFPSNDFLRLPRVDTSIPSAGCIVRSNAILREVTKKLFQANVFRSQDVIDARNSDHVGTQAFTAWITRQTIGLKVIKLHVSVNTADSEEICCEDVDPRALCMTVRGDSDGTCRELLPRAEMFRRCHEGLYPTAMDALVRLSWNGAPILYPAERYSDFLEQNFDGDENIPEAEIQECLMDRHGEIEDVTEYLPSFRKRLMGGNDCVKMQSVLTPEQLTSLPLRPASLPRRLAKLTALSLNHLASGGKDLELLRHPHELEMETAYVGCHLIYRPHVHEQQWVDDWWANILNAGDGTDMWRWSTLPNDLDQLVETFRQWQYFFKSVRLLDAMLDVISVDSWFND